MVFGLPKGVGGSPPDARLYSTAAMEFIGGASRAVKYHGFATPPLKNVKKDIKKTLGTEIDINMRASDGLHVPEHIRRCPGMHVKKPETFG